MKKIKKNFLILAQEGIKNSSTFDEVLRISTETISKIDKADISDKRKETLKADIRNRARSSLIIIANGMFQTMERSCLFFVFHKFYNELIGAINEEHLEWKQLQFTEEKLAYYMYNIRNRELMKLYGSEKHDD